MYITRSDELGARDCALCGYQFVAGVNGDNVAVYDKEGGELLAISCNDCCPGAVEAIKKHFERSWFVRLFTRPDFKNHNIDILKVLGDLRMISKLNNLKKINELISLDEPATPSEH